MSAFGLWTVDASGAGVARSELHLQSRGQLWQLAMQLSSTPQARGGGGAASGQGRAKDYGNKRATRRIPVSLQRKMLNLARKRNNPASRLSRFQCGKR